MDKYNELIEAFMELYPDAAVTEFLDKTTFSDVRELTDKNIWKIGCDAHKSFVNFYNPRWKCDLGSDGLSPSVKDYDWVMNRLLVLHITRVTFPNADLRRSAFSKF